MDPQIGWFQPEQGKRAKEFWMQIWDAHIFSRVNSKSNFPENNTNNVLGKFQENIENIPDNRRLPPLNMNHLNSILNSMNKASTYYMNKFQHNLIGKYGGTPWRIRKSYDSNAIIGLHQEVEDFFVYMSPTPEEHQVRLGIIANVKSIILTLWPKAQVEVFGSFQTSLYLPTSDIDMVVIGEWEQLPLRTLQDALLSSGICEPDNIKVLDKASVPIVKFNDRLSDVKVDISFNMNNGVKSVELINHFCVQFPSLKKLVLVLKQFLLQRDLNEVFHGGISSYSLILMCISFLQLHTHQDPSRYDNNLGIMLIEFFELYGRKFNYIRAAISIKNGGKYISKDELQKDMTDGHRPSILSIEDPLTQGNDIGRGSYGALQVKQAFEYAFMVITQAISLGIDSSQSSILGRIIRVTDRVVDYRSWLRTAFPIPKPPKSNDGSISSLQSADSDSESNHGHSNDLSTLPILPLPKFPRRTMNNGLRFPPSSVTGYVRGGDMNNFSILNHQHYHLYHHNQHHGAIAADVPKIQNTAGAAALNITMNGAAGNHLNNNHHLANNGFHHHHHNANQNRHHMNVHHNIYNNSLHNKVHMNNNNGTGATSGAGNNGNNANRYYSHTPYYNHRRIKSQQFVRHKTTTNNNSNSNNDVAEENNNLR